VVVGRRRPREKVVRQFIRRLRQHHLEVVFTEGTCVTLLALTRDGDADGYRRRRFGCIDFVGDVLNSTS
jgi:hypothetical protein